ncbi:MAG TPA: hypothetical protein VIM65_15825 [Cyclobacteriaceae bacterium]
MEHSSNVQLSKGNMYQATLVLGGLEVMASNSQVADKLKELGFSELKVMGVGATRYAVGKWTLPSQTVPIPPQVRNVSKYSPVKPLC